MEKIKIIIIDSGVRVNHPKFKEDSIKGFSLIEGRKSENFEDDYGHGTAIYNIIRKCNDIADILNIKVPDIEHGTGQNVLVEVLEYIHDNEKADIINLSLGCSGLEDNRTLQRVCSRLSQKGIIICSAFDNDGSISYPAYFDDVIGIITDETSKTI